MLHSLVAMFVISVLPQSSGALLEGSRREEKEGWIYVRLQGTPRQIGFQHGYWLAPEIKEGFDVGDFFAKHEGLNPATEWGFAKATAHRLIWNYCNQDEKDEIEGIAEGMRARGYKVDADDILASNGAIELGYYFEWLKGQVPYPPKPSPPEHCSAFVATGSATKDGGVVIGHSCWTPYVGGERENVIFDIRPDRGYRILMDGVPGWIFSGDDYAINSQGIAMTETTISGYRGFDEKGIPEFLRMRRSIQFSRNIADVRRIMTTGNNGSYANMWLLADTKSNEIAKLEIGLKAIAFTSTRDGSYGSSNFPEAPGIIAECPGYKGGSNTCSDRHARWDVLLKENKGKIDTELGKQFLGDHHDEVSGNDKPSYSSLCGHGDEDARPTHHANKNFPEGAVEAKVADTKQIRGMQFWARMGHPCGSDFLAKPFFEKNPQFAWMAPVLHDMKGHAWTVFRSN